MMLVYILNRRFRKLQKVYLCAAQFSLDHINKLPSAGDFHVRSAFMDVSKNIGYRNDDHWDTRGLSHLSV